MKNNISEIGWNFHNTYIDLPKVMLTHFTPVPVKKPELVILNDMLAKELGLNFFNLSEKEAAAFFSGNTLPEGSDPIAQAYAGHQFGHFTMLGDGRAIVLGEHITPDKKKFDIQYKGSGQTPYSRGADGRAALGPMLREYIISEAMHGLGIPTTRSLAVIKTGEYVFRETPLLGSILTRIADSHLRVGTFQYVASLGDVKTLKILVDYAIRRHYPDLIGIDNPSVALLDNVMKKQIELVIHWMRVGFIHGVMNTDNMTISGETIDYGPCAFMDTYDEQTCFSSIDHNGRYSYGNQPAIVHWNLARFAETLLPLIHEKENKAIEIAGEIIGQFQSIYKKQWLQMMRKKIGLFGEEKEDEALILKLLLWMQNKKADYTNTFCYLMKQDTANNDLYHNDDDFTHWYKEWVDRLERNLKSKEYSLEIMKESNPILIPRNHNVEEALHEAEIQSDLTKIKNLLKFLATPYEIQSGIDLYQIPPELGNVKYQTFCGT